ncbi:DEAD/DEAH box helicase, partial [Asaia krungthepensis]|uniref:DEAD/DEAH box helicase n=1 Tax=Asaia krungthepensis TaxID=220990 RepID=UPI0038CF7E13
MPAPAPAETEAAKPARGRKPGPKAAAKTSTVKKVATKARAKPAEAAAETQAEPPAELPREAAPAKGRPGRKRNASSTTAAPARRAAVKDAKAKADAQDNAPVIAAKPVEEAEPVSSVVAQPAGEAPAEVPAASRGRRGRGGRKSAESSSAPTGETAPAAEPEITAAPLDEAMKALVDAPKPLFSELGLSTPIMRAIEEMGYEHPTPIQARAIPVVLGGQDVLGVAQTGTGKTASFTLPMLERLAGSRARARMPRSLILEPTRELALQVAENLTLYGKHLRLNHALLIGGESMADQRAVLNQGVDILIATPGRLMDLFDRGGLLLTQTSILVIDEADRMLDMGFIPDITRIVSMLPVRRQTLLFSATMAPEIRTLADQFLHLPEEITVSRPSSVATTIEEALLVVDEADKRRVLRKLLKRENVQNAIVFCNRKRDVDVLYKSLHKHGFAVGHLHGDLAQSLRFKTLERFKAGELQILVCSDVAARGIDIGGLSHVFNFDLPFNAEDYIHRIGRTGRAGKTGHAFSLATPRQKQLAEAIEKLKHAPIPMIEIDGIETLPWADPEQEGTQPERRERRHGKDRGGRHNRHG